MYCQKVFSYIRHTQGIDEEQIISSLDPKNNRFQLFKTNTGKKHNTGGKSGSFFFFSQDRKFLIKTLRKDELDVFLELLPNMVQYLFENKSATLLSQVLGIYKVKISGVTPVYLMVQANNLQPSA